MLPFSHRSLNYLQLARAPKILKAVRLIRVLRLMRLSRISRVIGKLKDRMAINPGLFALTIFLSMVVIGTHWLACLWFFVGTIMDDDEVVFQLNDQQLATWSTAHEIVVYNLNETTGLAIKSMRPIYCLRFNYTLLDPDCKEVSTGEQYVVSVYWAVTSLCTVGYGDVLSRTLYEYSLSIIVMLAGGFCFAYMVGGLSVMLERVTTRNKVLKDKLYELDGFMHRQKIPKTIRMGVREHLTKQENSKYHIPAMLRSMHGSLKNDIFLLLYQDLVRSVPFFKRFSDRAIVYLIGQFKYRGLPAGEAIYRQGTVGDTIYFIRTGRVQMSIVNQQKTSTTAWVVESPGFFGENIVMNKNERIASAITQSWCNIFTLTKDDIADTCRRYPDAEIALDMFARQLDSKWRKAVGRVAGQLRLAKGLGKASAAPTNKPAEPEAPPSGLVNGIVRTISMGILGKGKRPSVEQNASAGPRPSFSNAMGMQEIKHTGQPVEHSRLSSAGDDEAFPEVRSMMAPLRERGSSTLPSALSGVSSLGKTLSGKLSVSSTSPAGTVSGVSSSAWTTTPTTTGVLGGRGRVVVSGARFGDGGDADEAGPPLGEEAASKHVDVVPLRVGEAVNLPGSAVDDDDDCVPLSVRARAGETAPKASPRKLPGSAEGFAQEEGEAAAAAGSRADRRVGQQGVKNLPSEYDPKAALGTVATGSSQRLPPGSPLRTTRALDEIESASPWNKRALGAQGAADHESPIGFVGGYEPPAGHACCLAAF